MDNQEGTAQRRLFQFVVRWIGDAQSRYLRAAAQMYPEVVLSVVAAEMKLLEVSQLNEDLLCPKRCT